MSETAIPVRLFIPNYCNSMKAFFFILVLIYQYQILFGQINKDELIGNWVKTRLETVNGEETSGKFGESSQFLRISINENEIYFSITPFDEGYSLKYKIGHDSILVGFDTFNFADIDAYLPEKFYIVEKIGLDKLILRTSYKNQDIRYHFQRQLGTKAKLNDSVFLCENDTLVLIRYLSNGSVSYYTNCSATRDYFYAEPLFKGPVEFGNYLSHGLKRFARINRNEFSKPIKVSFYIDYLGKVSDVELVEGFKEYYDKQLLKLITATDKNWIPNILENPRQHAKMIFTFVLLDIR